MPFAEVERMVLILLVFLGLALGLFVYQDQGEVNLTFGIWTWHVPQWYPVLAAAGAMLLIALLWTALTRRRLRYDERALGVARHEAVLANHGALLADHESAIAGLQRDADRVDQELSRRRDLLA
jgi:uncharacterized integral membrane protein